MPQGEAGGSTNGAKATAKGLVSRLEAILDEYMVKKAPFTLPAELKSFIATVSPYLIIVFAVLGLPVILTGLGISAVLAPVSMMGAAFGYGFGLNAMISLVIAIIALIMEVVAVPGLFKRTRGGWNMVFYASIVSFIGNILSFNIIGGIIGAIIGWYILFQVKELYKN